MSMRRSEGTTSLSPRLQSELVQSAQPSLGGGTPRKHPWLETFARVELVIRPAGDGQESVSDSVTGDSEVLTGERRRGGGSERKSRGAMSKRWRSTPPSACCVPSAPWR
eukprot:2796579-Heterocapsa_arctica.AAC.1